MIFVFDIDGVLTPKSPVKINLGTMTQAEIQKAIIEAKASEDGFALLDDVLRVYPMNMKNNRIRFLTGRKKSEYYNATRNLFRQRYGDGYCQFLLSKVVFYPEEKIHIPLDYYMWKKEMITEWSKEVFVIVFDDDAELIRQLHGIRNLIPVHFEAMK